MGVIKKKSIQCRCILKNKIYKTLNVIVYFYIYVQITSNEDVGHLAFVQYIFFIPLVTLNLKLRPHLM